jgi:hypothetical protein
MANTTFKGEEAVQRVILRAIQVNVAASRPVLEGGRYDLVLDIAGFLRKVQVKYAGQGARGVVKVLVASTSCRGKKGKVYADHEVDLIFAYSPATNKIYKLPPEVWRGKRVVHLRYEPTKNNQKRGLIDATKFEW